MKRIARVVVAVVLFAMLCACAGQQLSQDTSPEELKSRGIAIVSVTHDYATGAGASPVFLINSRRRDTNELARQLRSRPNFGGIPTRSDFGDVYGHVYVLSMAPGTHQIDGWFTVGGNLRISPRLPPPPLRFEVRAGEVIYLGNLNMNHESGRGLFGSRLVGALPEVRDHRTIDIPVAEAKAPIIKGKVVVQLLPTGEWYASGIDAVQDSVPPPESPPPPQK